MGDSWVLRDVGEGEWRAEHQAYHAAYSGDAAGRNALGALIALSSAPALSATESQEVNGRNADEVYAEHGTMTPGTG